MLDQKSETRRTAIVLNQDPSTGKVQKNAVYKDKNTTCKVFFWVIPFIKLQNDTKQQLNGEKR